MVEQKSDYYCNLVPGIKLWDTCASEAIMMSMFGFVVNASHNKSLEYDSDTSDYTIRGGVIAAKTK